MQFDSIIFDLDGTLWNATNGILETWNKTISRFSEVEKPLTIADIEGVMGLALKDLSLKLFPYLDVETRLKIASHCLKEECELLQKQHTILYDGLEKTLSKLSKNYKLFIVSNCQCGYIEAFFDFHGYGKYFQDFENAERTGLSKGENIKLIIERNNLKSPIYVGDTTGDLAAAKHARIPFVYAAYGFGEVKEYDFKIDCLEELLGILG